MQEYFTNPSSFTTTVRIMHSYETRAPDVQAKR